MSIDLEKELKKEFSKPLIKWREVKETRKALKDEGKNLKLNGSQLDKWVDITIRVLRNKNKT